MKNLTISLLAYILLSQSSSAQETSLVTGWGIGLQGGIQWNMPWAPRTITSLPQTFIRRAYAVESYSVKETETRSMIVGLPVIFRSNNWPWVSAQGDLNFSNFRAGYEYEDIEGLLYNLDFNYWFATMGLTAKISPMAENKITYLQGIFFRFGVQAGLILNPDQLHYVQKPENIWGNSKYIERELQALAEGKNDFGFVGGLGWEIPLGGKFETFVEAKYYHGISDILKGYPNSYGFDWDSSNRIHNFQGVAGFIMSFQ